MATRTGWGSALAADVGVGFRALGGVAKRGVVGGGEVVLVAIGP